MFHHFFVNTTLFVICFPMVLSDRNVIPVCSILLVIVSTFVLYVGICWACFFFSSCPFGIRALLFPLCYCTLFVFCSIWSTFLSQAFLLIYKSCLVVPSRDDSLGSLFFIFLMTVSTRMMSRGFSIFSLNTSSFLVSDRRCLPSTSTRRGFRDCTCYSWLGWR